MPEPDDVIQVILTIHDKSGTYSCHAGVVLTSLFSNTKSPVNVTILHDDTLTDDNRRRFARTAERFCQRVSFISVGEHISRVADDPDKAGKAIGRVVLFRLLVPEFMSIPKVIYLDCDLVVNLDIKELWDADIGNASIGAVLDPSALHYQSLFGVKIEKLRKQTFKYADGTYFNAGVLVMNLDKLRARHDLIKESSAFFSRYHDLATWADQDFLNACCSGDVTYLDERFNFFIYDIIFRQGRKEAVENTIIHFADYPPKVWERFPKIPEDVLYWKYFLTSEWNDQMLDVLSESVPEDAASPRKEKPNPSFPVDRVPPGSSIVLYGAGGLGHAWYYALKLIKYCRVILWVDKRADELHPPVTNVSKIKRAKYDYVVIAVSSRKIAREISDDLVSNYGVKPERLVYLGKGESK